MSGSGYPLGLSAGALALITVACWTVAAALAIYVWWTSRQRRWEGVWIDGPDSARRRVALGADRVRGPVVYRHFDDDGREVYVGQTGKRRRWWRRSNPRAFADRMASEGKEIMALTFARWEATSVPRYSLDLVERARIGIARARNPRLLNRTRGNRGRR